MKVEVSAHPKAEGVLLIAQLQFLARFNIWHPNQAGQSENLSERIFEEHWRQVGLSNAVSRIFTVQLKWNELLFEVDNVVSIKYKVDSSLH